MKLFLNLTKYVAAFTLLGCANHLQEKENLAAAAGFKVITATKPSHDSLLSNLPADTMTQINYQGRTFYVLPGSNSHEAYVGGPKQYQAYQQLRLAKKLDAGHVQAAEREVASMNWGMWGDWGGGWYNGWY